ncbi:fatty acid-binding protein TM_1468 [Paraliobacillus ryukyuensis]|uniref:DegV family protein with EDD domain n=1 Tax=Paraliobacillus ryukyuensis TaxID=200904 RepID=A0A366E760_9BACI|nr:DegV family protein [Paraliobacillus ryukyuensis]RBO98216.1 DegV family protein with EDD domain [Paraliobacillus ryukyuensis]
MNVQIITDSAADLTQEDLNTYHIDSVPLTVERNGEIFEDGKTISAKTIYDGMRVGDTPKTSQVSPQAFETVFRKYAKENKPCVYLSFSSQLSGTYQSAKIAETSVKANYPNWQLTVIDTKCASLGFGLVVLRAAELANQGASLSEIEELSHYHAAHMEHIFTVDDLEYLYRGGRVSKSAAFVGTLLKIKPLLHVDDGKLVPLEKIRGSKRVWKRMLELMEERGQDLNNQRIGISHGDAYETADQLAEMIRERFDVNEIKINMVGSSIGAHSGPGTIALFFLNDTYR